MWATCRQYLSYNNMVSGPRAPLRVKALSGTPKDKRGLQRKSNMQEQRKNFRPCSVNILIEIVAAYQLSENPSQDLNQIAPAAYTVGATPEKKTKLNPYCIVKFRDQTVHVTQPIQGW